MVSRRTSFSFECHPDVLLEELEQEMGALFLSLELKILIASLFGGSSLQPNKPLAATVMYRFGNILKSNVIVGLVIIEG